MKTACLETKSKIPSILSGFRLFPQAILLIRQIRTPDSYLADLYLECGYKDFQCIRNKTKMSEEKQIRISSTFFLTEMYALEKH